MPFIGKEVIVSAHRETAHSHIWSAVSNDEFFLYLAIIATNIL